MRGRPFVSRAEPGDAAEILRLQQLAFTPQAELYNDFSLPPLLQTLAEMEQDIAAMTVLKAVLQDAAQGLPANAIIGSVRARAEDAVCHVGRLVVHPNFQNQGLGARLMHRIEAEFAACERYEIFTGHKSAKNLRLYEKLGYKVVRTQVVSPDLSLVYMEKVGGEEERLGGRLGGSGAG